MPPEISTTANDGVTVVSITRNGESVCIRLSHGPVSIVASVDRSVLEAMIERPTAPKEAAA